jgi:arylamine N-acetyltransferase
LFQALNTPHGFSENLYVLVTEDLGLSKDEVINLVKKGVICQGGYCYDLGDVGSNCC